MNIKNILSLAMFILVIFLLVNFKVANAQELVQPMLGGITSINAGTDRIMETLQPDDEFQENVKLKEESKSEKLESHIIRDGLEIEVFYPPSEQEKHSTTNKNQNNTKNKDVTKIITDVSGGVLKTDAGNGGEVKNKIVGADIAVVREFENSNGTLSIGGLVDYEQNSYDSNFQDTEGTGKAKSVSAGVIVRQQNTEGLYYEGSARIGRVKNDFDVKDYSIDNEELNINGNTSASMYAGHVKAGKIIHLDEQHDADIYGAYAFSHQDYTNAKLSNGNNYRFKSVNSNRVKVGCRMTTKVDNGKIYYGLAYQYETNADAYAEYNGRETLIASAKGSSGVLELGYTLVENKNSALNIDLNAAGYIGRQKGFIIQAQLVKSF